MPEIRIRVGIAKFDDGWNVIVQADGKTVAYDPTFATESEAETMANDMMAALRRDIEIRGRARPPQGEPR